MAEVVYRLLETLNMVGEVEAICFDTTSSNSGIHRESVKLLQDKLNRPIMFLACRHHIGELAIKHASEVVRGPSQGSDDPLFKKFKTEFQTIDNNKTSWVWPEKGTFRESLAVKVLEWTSKQMNKDWPREDYRELLELITVFIGGQVTRVRAGIAEDVDFHIRKQGKVLELLF